MSTELVVGIAVGAPATIVAVLAYMSSRSKDQRDQASASALQFRQMFADLIAPFSERLTDVEEDVREVIRREHPHP